MSPLTNYKLVYTVPASHLQATKEAIFMVGGGTYPGGKYARTAFEIPGYGQFMPVAEAGAAPHIGTPGKLERTEETRVEIICVGEEVARASVAALKMTHPYEVVAYEVFKMEDF
ncbi:MAG: hypothetical protein M1818_001484 [Claussenomyces sp. TS43310]|nr:MAG: hypothetical protein M1818_001484 [Claussenomyces sp. TS43310]